MNGPVVFPTFFNLSLNFAIRSSWSEPQPDHVLLLLLLLLLLFSPDCIEFSIFGCKEHNQCVFYFGHLVMSMCRVFSCAVGRGYLLLPVHSLGKTLFVFIVIHNPSYLGTQLPTEGFPSRTRSRMHLPGLLFRLSAFMPHIAHPHSCRRGTHYPCLFGWVHARDISSSVWESISYGKQTSKRAIEV